MKKVAELKDNEVRGIVYMDVTGDYTFEARLLSFDDQEGEVIRREHGLTLSEAMKEVMSCLPSLRNGKERRSTRSTRQCRRT